MAEKEELILEVELDADRAKSDIKDLGRDLTDAEEAAKEFGLAFETTEQKIRSVSDVIEAMAETVDANLRANKAAADALGNALGPELSAKVDVAQIVADLERMGLTTEEIKANADQLAASLQKVDGIKTQGLADGLDYTNSRMTGLRNNADQSRSVLANMAGNSAQDLGALGGVVGSLGVGIGQLAEYAVDGNIKLANLAKVAGPMLGVALAAKGIGDAISGIKAEEAFRAGLVDDFTESLREAGTVAETLYDTVLKTGELDFSEGGQGIFGLGREAADLLPILDQVGLSLEEFIRLTEAPPDRDTLIGQLVPELQASGLSMHEALDVAGDLADAVDQYAGSSEAAAEKLRILNEVVQLTPEAVSAAVDAFRTGKDPLEQYRAEFTAIATALANDAVPATATMERVTEGLGISMQEALQIASDYGDELIGTGQSLQEFVDAAANAADPVAALADAGGSLLFFFNELVDDVKDGTVNINDADAALTQLATALNMTNDEVAALILQKADEELQAEAEAAEAAAEAQREHAEALRETSAALAETVAGFNAAALRGEGFASALERINGKISELDASREVIEFSDGLRGIHEALHDLDDALTDTELADLDLVPDSWEEVRNMPEELKPVLDALAGFRDTMQTEFTQAFEHGGPEEAREWAANARTAIVEELALAGIESEEQVNEILSALGLLPEQVEITIEAANADQARQIIDDIGSAIEALPTDVQLQIAAVAKDDPVAALELTIAALREAGIEVPVELVAVATELGADIPPVEVPATIVPDPNQKVLPDLEPLLVTTTPDLAAIDEIDAAVAEDRTAVIETEARTGDAAAELDQVTDQSRTAVIDTDARTGDADAELDRVAAARRTAVIDAILGDIPTAAQIRSRIGRVVVPIDARWSGRIEGNRPR